MHRLKFVIFVIWFALGLFGICAAQLKTPEPTPEVQKLLDAAYALKDPQAKLAGYEKALEAARSVKDRVGEAWSLGILGYLLNSFGQEEKALENDIQALPILRDVGDRLGEAVTLSNIGWVYDNLGQEQKALEYYNKALPIEREVGDRSREATTLNNIGAVYWRLGEEQKALEYYNQALPILRDVGNRSVEATTLGNIGVVYKNLGQEQKALEYYNQALPIEREVGDRSGEATTLTNIGSVYDNLGQEQKALEYYNKVLPILRDVGNRSVEATTLTGIGSVYKNLGQEQKALEYYNKALPIEREVGDRSREATTLNNIGAVYWRLGEEQKALEYYNKALPIEREVGDRSGEANTLDNIAYALRTQSGALATVFAKQCVNVYQSLRKDIQGLPKADQEAYAKAVEPAYRRLGDMLIKQGRLGEAEQVINLLKDEETFNYVRRDAARAGATEEKVVTLATEEKWWGSYEALEGKAQAIEEAQYETQQQLDKLPSTEKAADEQKRQIAALKAKLADLDSQVQTLNKGYDAYFAAMKDEAKAMAGKIAEEAAKRMDQVKDALPGVLNYFSGSGDKVAAVYGLAAKDEFDFLIVTPNGSSHSSVDVGSDKLNAMISDFRSVLLNPDLDPRPAGKQLYDLLFAKLLTQLEAAKVTRIVWCLDGTLRYIPIEALWDGNRYLVERPEKFSMFDPNHLENIKAPPSAKAEVAAFADSEGQAPKYPPIPGAKQELEGVASDPGHGFKGLVPGQGLLNKDFDWDSFGKAVRNKDYTLLHIATHFDVGRDYASSYFLLGDGEKSLQDFSDLTQGQKLGHLDLICLSACNTAETLQDAEMQGSQLSSFVSLALGQGASSVIASLWPVNDSSTPALMKQFYENWLVKHEDKAQALKDAQLAMLNGGSAPADSTKRANADTTEKAPPNAPPYPKNLPRFSHPYYWAPFLLFGNWR